MFAIEVLDFDAMTADSLAQTLDRAEGFLTLDTGSGNIGLHDSSGDRRWSTDNGWAKEAFYDLKESGRLVDCGALPLEERINHYPDTIGSRFPIQIYRLADSGN